MSTTTTTAPTTATAADLVSGDHRPALDAAGLQVQARVADLGSTDEVVQRHAIPLAFPGNGNTR